MIVKCKECGTSIEVDEALYQEGLESTTLCPLCGEVVRFSIVQEKKEISPIMEDSQIDSICPNCGAKMASNHHYCPNCGHRFDVEEPSKKNNVENDESLSETPISHINDVKCQTEKALKDVEVNIQSELDSKSSKSNTIKGGLGCIISLLCIFTLGIFIVIYMIYSKSPSNIKEESSARIISLERGEESIESEDLVVSSEKGEYTDLGLSVLWSNYNIGALSEFDYGYLYGWGNTRTELSMDLSQYPCADPPYSIKGTKYDVAQAIWGGNWRMPTLAELKELKESCNWILVDYSQGRFYKVTGPNGNSILLPLAGYKRGNEYKSVGEWGFIWSSELYEGNSQFAANLAFGGKKGIIETSGYYRYGGESIRPVMDKR